MDVKYINPFLTATISVFREMFAIEPTVGALYVEDRSRRHRWEISGVMVLTGNAIGVIALRLCKLLANKLLQQSGVRYESEEEREKLVDGMVGEMTNIITGNASSQLSEYDIKVSVPMTIQGIDHTLTWPDYAPIIGIPFHTAHGPFLVDVCLIDLKGPKKDAPRPPGQTVGVKS